MGYCKKNPYPPGGRHTFLKNHESPRKSWTFLSNPSEIRNILAIFIKPLGNPDSKCKEGLGNPNKI